MAIATPNKSARRSLKSNFPPILASYTSFAIPSTSTGIDAAQNGKNLSNIKTRSPLTEKWAILSMPTLWINLLNILPSNKALRW